MNKLFGAIIAASLAFAGTSAHAGILGDIAGRVVKGANNASSQAKNSSAPDLGLGGLTKNQKDINRKAADRRYEAYKSCYDYNTRGMKGVPVDTAKRVNALCDDYTKRYY